MAAYLPYLIQAGEALLVGVGVGVAAYQAAPDLHAALVAGFGAFVAKLLPKRVTPGA